MIELFNWLEAVLSPLCLCYVWWLSGHGVTLALKFGQPPYRYWIRQFANALDCEKCLPFWVCNIYCFNSVDSLLTLFVYSTLSIIAFKLMIKV